MSATTSATSGGDCWGQQFGNNAMPPTLGDDAVGNLTTIGVTQCTAPSLSVTVNASNQITASGFSYDSDGNGTADALYGYTYDAEGRLTSANTGTLYCYLYDGDNLRVAKAISSDGTDCNSPNVYEIYWRDEGGNTIAESDGTGSTTDSSYTEYVFFQGQRIAQFNPNTTCSSMPCVHYYFTDQLGSTRLVTDSSGNPCYEADFLPYGTENTPAGFTNTCAPNYKFTGYERDPETGNDYAFARYFNPRLGRFMTPDPGVILGDVTDPQTLNRYTYTRNNPVNMIDPTGLDGGGTGLVGIIIGIFDAILEALGLFKPPPEVALNPPQGSPGDPFGGETNGIPNGLNIPSGGLPGIGGCTYGSGNCGGMIYGFTYNGMTFASYSDFLKWLNQVWALLNYLKTHPVSISVNEIGAFQATYQYSTNTLCANLGLGASFPPTKMITAGVYNNGNMQDWTKVLSGWGYSFSATLWGIGYQASMNSAEKIGGPAAAPTGVSGSYTWGKCGQPHVP